MPYIYPHSSVQFSLFFWPIFHLFLYASSFIGDHVCMFAFSSFCCCWAISERRREILTLLCYLRPEVLKMYFFVHALHIQLVKIFKLD